ncbi:MAG: ATP-binding protein [Planctomycetes bacterium]|nr:ATP-binding protein [Planctomycetota bacterium]
MSQKRLIWHLYPSYLVVTLVAVVAVTAYCSAFFRQVHHGQVRDALDQLAGVAAEQARMVLQAEGPNGLDKLCKQFAQSSKDRTRLTIIAPSGKVLGDSHENPAAMDDHSGRPEMQEALRIGSGSSGRFSPTLGKQMMYVAVALREQGTPVAVVRAAAPLTEIDQTLHAVYLHMFWAGLAVAAAIAVLSLLVSRRISRPIATIEQVAQRFAAGEMDVRVPTPDSTELATLADSLNRMAMQLGERITTITEQRNKLDAVLSSMAEGVFAVDNRGRIVSVNRAAAELLGMDAAQTQVRPVEEVIRNVDLQEYVRQTLAGVPPAEVDIFLPINGGRSFSLHGAALTDARGRRSGAVIVLNDMTRIRRLETIRRDFVANVSHELKTPVTSIQGFVEALVDGSIKDPVQVERYLGIIARHTSRLNSIIEDLLTLSRLEEAGEQRALTFAVSPVKPVIEEAIDLSGVKAEEKRIRVDLVCDNDVEARINPPLLEQAIINLIDNAVKYSPEGSHIQVETHRSDGEVSIAVTDEGCGIPAEHLPRIFERFYVVDKSRSRKLGGTGLGLAIVKHIAQAHGGRVTVESTPGKGSTFAFHLPL